MTRQISFSKPRSSGGASDGFAAWLTADLRPKGSGAPPSSRAPLSLRPEPRPEQLALARWLTSDLRPRGSSAPPPSSLVLAPESSPAPPDSLAPQVVPADLVVSDAAALAPAVDLDADDLAVLPSRRSRARGARGRWLGPAAALLLVAGLGTLLLGRASSDSSDDAGAAAAAAAVTEVLPPPPPDTAPAAVEPSVELAEAPVPRPTVAGGSARSLAEDAEEPDVVLRGRGRSTARFADLPSPTLSKLARQERERARSRAADVRRNDTGSSAEPPAFGTRPILP